MQHSSETPSDLTAWLREQIDEDERVAQAADKRHPGAWVDSGSGDLSSRGSSSGGKIAIVEGVGWVWSQPAARHVVHNDPARALREIETKRLIIEVAESWRHRVVEDCWYTCPAATEQREGEVSCNDDNWEPGQGPCNCGVDQRRHAVLGLLALPYADRPGYREEWRS